VQEEIFVRVTATEIEHLHDAIAEVEQRALGDQLGRRRDDDLSQRLGRPDRLDEPLLRLGTSTLLDPLHQQLPLVVVQVPGHQLMSVDGSPDVGVRTEPVVAEAVVEVGVGVHDPSHGGGAELAQVVANLVGLAM